MSKTNETTTGAGPTAGPWRAVAPTIERRKDVFASVHTNSDGAHGFPTCEFEIMADGYKNSEAAANARLIAAAPTMLAALRDWVRLEDEGMASGISLFALYTRTRAAIRAAEGGAA